jgi:hypothetical protein
MRFRLPSAKWGLLVGCLLAFCSGVVRTASAQTPSITEKIEWTWAVRPEAPDPALPNVLLEGDSITRGYYPEVAKLLAGKANCYLFATSASSGDPRLAGQMQDALQLFPVRYAVIHFNNGMHGWGYTEAQYEHGLTEMIAALRKHASGAKLVWGTTTPVRKDDPKGATNARVETRNQISQRLMMRDAIPVDDLHALMMQHQNLHSDDVHFQETGYGFAATQAANSILALLPNTK